MEACRRFRVDMHPLYHFVEPCPSIPATHGIYISLCSGGGQVRRAESRLREQQREAARRIRRASKAAAQAEEEYDQAKENGRR